MSDETLAEIVTAAALPAALQAAGVLMATNRTQAINRPCQAPETEDIAGA